MAFPASDTVKTFDLALLSPPAAYPIADPPELDQDTLNKLDKVVRHFTDDSYELPASELLGDESGKGLSERELMFLVRLRTFLYAYA